MTSTRVLLAMVVAAVVASACVGGADRPPPVDGIEAPDGFEVIEIASGLDGPTQLTRLPDGRLLVAELNGGEREGRGRVIAIDPDPRAGSQPEAGGSEAPEVLFDGLLTPTGIAVVGDEIWVMERRTLSRGPVGGGELTVVADELPFNGRSETTLTATPGGTLLYGTSGSLAADGRPVADSGILWELDAGPGTGVGSTAISAGFKNPYAHTVDAAGRLWVTEVSDGRFDGERAPDELVEVVRSVDHGWPGCIGDRIPVLEFGADAASCDVGPPSQALFEPGATPTSVAVSPWDPETLLVALWVEQRVVSVPMAAEGRPHAPLDVLTGRVRPQHLLADGDRLLVVDFDGGRILAVQPT